MKTSRERIDAALKGLSINSNQVDEYVALLEKNTDESADYYEANLNQVMAFEHAVAKYTLAEQNKGWSAYTEMILYNESHRAPLLWNMIAMLLPYAQKEIERERSES